jgi:hypothetical protein
MKRIVLMSLLGLAGLALAVGVTTAATSLTSQRVGLQEEPLTAGDDLAPASTRTQETDRQPTVTTEPEDRTTPTETATTPPPTITTPPSAVDDDNSGKGSGDDGGGDDSGSGRGRGRGRGGDDD